MVRKPKGRKLLIASLGVAAVSYVTITACGNTPQTSGNLVAPPTDAAKDTSNDGISSGNLVPPPIDAGDDGDAGDSGVNDASGN